MKSTTIAFYLLTTFSTNVEGGNPAAVVFMDLTRPLDVYKNIAHNFNQPITTFLSPLRRSKTCLAFNIRWFAPNGEELPLCGHGALAAARTIFESSLVKRQIAVLEFHTTSGRIVTARKCEKGLVEICLISAETVEVSAQERLRLQEVLNRTFGRQVAVNHIARGGEGYEQCKHSDFSVVTLLH
jgi:predicted PhzF superfamily epimerase YddE/YHI9